MSFTIVLDCICFLAIHKKLVLKSLQSWHNPDGIAVETSEYKVKVTQQIVKQKLSLIHQSLLQSLHCFDETIECHSNCSNSTDHSELIQIIDFIGRNLGTADYYYLRPPLCSVPFVPQAKFTWPQFTGPAFANPCFVFIIISSIYLKRRCQVCNCKAPVCLIVVWDNQSET